MKKLCMILVVLCVISLLTGCADTITIDYGLVEPRGFWYGWWHGLIIAWTFIGSLFDSSIAIYAVVNTGGWYNFGFILGASSFSHLIGSLVGIGIGLATVYFS